jgi:predicted nucleic acid-binding protein
MDFADATLVLLAERERLTTILTVDRDFDAYRIGGRKAFLVLPKL